mgnify:CR=1 FL=1
MGRQHPPFAFNELQLLLGAREYSAGQKATLCRALGTLLRHNGARVPLFLYLVVWARARSVVFGGFFYLLFVFVSLLMIFPFVGPLPLLVIFPGCCW